MFEKFIFALLNDFENISFLRKNKYDFYFVTFPFIQITLTLKIIT